MYQVFCLCLKHVPCLVLCLALDPPNPKSHERVSSLGCSIAEEAGELSALALSPMSSSLVKGCLQPSQQEFRWFQRTLLACLLAHYAEPFPTMAPSPRWHLPYECTFPTMAPSPRWHLRLLSISESSCSSCMDRLQCTVESIVVSAQFA